MLYKLFLICSFSLISSNLFSTPLKVGFIDELYLKDGKTESWGIKSLNGFKLNNGDDVTIIEKNVGFSAIKAGNTAKDLILNEKIDVLVGLRMGRQAMMVKEHAEEYKVPYISVMATPDEMFTKNGHVFSMAIRNSYQIESMLMEYTKDKNYKKVIYTFVTQDCFYCTSMERLLELQGKKFGIIVKKGATLLHNKPVPQELSSKEEFKSSSIAIFTDEFEGLSLIKNLHINNFKGVIMGGDSWSVQNLNLTEEKELLKNICIINSLSYDRRVQSPENNRFKVKYQKIYNETPGDLSALAFDIRSILASISKSCGEIDKIEDRRSCIKNNIYKSKMSGTSGLLQFENDGGRIKSQSVALKIGRCE